MDYQPITVAQWNNLKTIKENIRNYSLHNTSIAVRTITAGTMVSGYYPNIWEDNYTDRTIVDVLVSGEFWDTTGQNSVYGDGGVYRDADAQFLTHATHKEKFTNCTEIWSKLQYVSGRYLPDYVSGTNNLVSGDCYQVMGIRRLPFDYEVQVFLKLKKPQE